MAGVFDFLALLLTAALFVGVIVAVVVAVQQIQAGIAKTKESLKAKGLNITDHGISVKTDKRFDREAYIDAQQRGFIKGMSATSFGKVDEHGNHLPGTTPTPSRTPSHNSAVSTPTEEKKSRFAFRRGHSGSK